MGEYKQLFCCADKVVNVYACTYIKFLSLLNVILQQLHKESFHLISLYSDPLKRPSFMTQTVKILLHSLCSRGGLKHANICS